MTISILFPEVATRSLELTTHNQFYVLALYVWVALFLSRGELVESPASHDLVHLVLGIRMAVRKLGVGYQN